MAMICSTRHSVSTPLPFPALMLMVPPNSQPRPCAASEAGMIREGRGTAAMKKVLSPSSETRIISRDEMNASVEPPGPGIFFEACGSAACSAFPCRNATIPIRANRLVFERRQSKAVCGLFLRRPERAEHSTRRSGRILASGRACVPICWSRRPRWQHETARVRARRAPGRPCPPCHHALPYPRPATQATGDHRTQEPNI